jgi:hypothetical protein
VGRGGGFLPFRWLLLAAAVLVVLLWLSSLAFVVISPARDRAAEIDLAQPFNLVSAPTWRDALLVRIAITDTAIQEQRGVVQWQVGERIARAPFSVVADGNLRTVVIPVGIHPDWTGDLENLQIVFPKQTELATSLVLASVVQRSPLALDALLGWILTPLAVTTPSFSSLLLLTAFLVSIGLAVAALPIGAKTARRVMVGSIVAVCLVGSISVVVEQARLLAPLWQRFVGQDESTIALFVPHYAESAQVNELLVDAARTLPEGEILVFDPGPITSYLKVRAFYLLYPRRVSFAAPRPGRLPPAIVGVIQPAMGRPPAPGWQRAAGPLAGLEAWRAPSGNFPVPTAGAGVRQLHWGLLALAVVILAGFGIGSVLGWDGLLRSASALTFGAGLTTWWMTILSLAAIPWSLTTVGLPLAGLGVGLILIAPKVVQLRNLDFRYWFLPRWRRSKILVSVEHHFGRQEYNSETKSTVLPALQPRFHRAVLLLAAVIGFIFICLVAQASLTPLSDQDSWTTWGFNSRALFVEGSVLRFLDQYSDSEMNHPSYPVGLPLLNAWHYLALGGVSERLVKLLMPLWWLSLIGLVWSEARRLCSPWLAVGLTALMATTPILLDHATLGNADLPFTVALTVGAIALTRWIVTGDWRELMGALLALGAASWLKLDGIYLGLAFVLCAAVFRWLYLHFLGAKLTYRVVRQTATAILILMAIYAPWRWLIHNAGVETETPKMAMLAVTGLANLGRGLRVVVSELLLSHNNSTWSLLGSGFLILWPVCIVIVLVRGQTARRNAPFLFLVTAALTTMIFYVFIYVLRPYFSIERYVMHAAPLAVLAAIHALADESPGERLTRHTSQPSRVSRYESAVTSSTSMILCFGAPASPLLIVDHVLRLVFQLVQAV